MRRDKFLTGTYFWSTMWSQEQVLMHRS